MLIRLGVTLAVVLVAAVVVDFGTTVFAEYRFARSVRAAARLNWDPSVAILGFPFIPQAMRRHYSEVEIKANDVEHPLVGKASLEATMHSIDLSDSSWLIGPDAKLPVGKLESRIIIDSAHLGRFMGINDLMVEAPAAGHQRRHRRHHRIRNLRQPRPGVHRHPEGGGLRQAGQRLGGPVDRPAGQTTLVLTPTGVLTGPGTADQEVPDDKKQAVLDAFRSALPDQKLPVRRGADQPGRPGFRCDHRGHHRRSNHHPRRVQTVMSTSVGVVIAVLIGVLGAGARSSAAC